MDAEIKARDADGNVSIVMLGGRTFVHGSILDAECLRASQRIAEIEADRDAAYRKGWYDALRSVGKLPPISDEKKCDNAKGYEPMADITKCRAHKCPSRDKCLRWTAPASDRQSYALFLVRERDQKCDDFISNEKR